MNKKRFVFIITICLVLSFSIPTLATPYYISLGDESVAEESVKDIDLELENIITQKDADITEQFLFSITRPDGDEITHKKSYVICGVANEAGVIEDLRVVLSVYNENTEVYERLNNIDGVSSWDIGSFGMFTKEVILKEGINKLKIIVYKKSSDELEIGTNIQVNTFTVNVLRQGIIKKIANGTLRMNEIFQGILPGSMSSKK